MASFGRQIVAEGLSAGQSHSKVCLVRFPASAARSAPKAVESFGWKLDCNLIDGLEYVFQSLSCSGKPAVVLYRAATLCSGDTARACTLLSPWACCEQKRALDSRGVEAVPQPSGFHHMLHGRILSPAVPQLCLWPLTLSSSPNLQSGNGLSSDLVVIALSPAMVFAICAVPTRFSILLASRKQCLTCQLPGASYVS